MTAVPGQARRARIELLPPEVAARIAAGEVIERPASVVKELAENALDAGAAVVEVEIEGGGRDRIRVRDDGHGIPAEQLADAFERHATSKLRSERELFAVRTLGFRGEALAAIAAAADVDLVTRPAEEGAAAVARYRDGRPDGRGAAAAAPGTSVEVRDLFAALPARRRFLRTARAEGRAVAQVISELAIAHPAVAFRLRSDGRRVLSTPGGGDLVEAVAAVHGAELAAALLAVEGRREAEGAGVEVGGAAGAPSTHRATRRTLLVVANGRTVRAPAIAHAVERAYEGLLPAGRHPVAFLRVDVPPDQIDVNVHPTKAELRLRHQRLVDGAVGAAVREALLGAAAAAGPPLAGPALPASPRETAAAAGASPPRPTGGARAVLAGARPVPPRPPSPGESPAQGALPLRDRLPALRPLGQVGRTYLAAEAPDGLYLVDQHAAHERVRYEELTRQRHSGRAQPQPLLQAAVAPLSAALLALAQEQAEELRALGWELAPTDGAALLVRAVPAPLADGDPARALADYLERLGAEQGLNAPQRAAAALACRAAVRAGDRLDGDQQRALLRSLERAEAPLTCPHGRPTVLHLSSDALARSFGRR